MGWFSLPVEAPDVKTNFLFGEPLTQRLQVPEHQKLDRQWEILSILVPSLSVEGSYEGHFAQVGGGSLEHLLKAQVQAAWSPEVSLAISFNILQSGLPVGSLPFTQVLKPFAKNIDMAEKIYNFEFDVRSVTLADSLQNPIVISGAEKIECTVTYAINVALLTNFTYEFEEGSGESKHSVTKEVFPETQALNMTYSYNRFEPPNKGPAMVLYVNESDRENPNAPTPETAGPLRPSSIPM